MRGNGAPRATSPANRISRACNRAANVVALGALIALSDICDRETAARAVGAGTPKAFLDLNLAALQRGFDMADDLSADLTDNAAMR